MNLDILSQVSKPSRIEQWMAAGQRRTKASLAAKYAQLQNKKVKRASGTCSSDSTREWL